MFVTRTIFKVAISHNSFCDKKQSVPEKLTNTGFPFRFCYLCSYVFACFMITKHFQVHKLKFKQHYCAVLVHVLSKKAACFATKDCIGVETHLLLVMHVTSSIETDHHKK